jgi:hypothetical protein
MSKWWTVSALSMMPLALCSFVAAGADPLANERGPGLSPPTVVILGPESSDDVTTQAMARVNRRVRNFRQAMGRIIDSRDMGIRSHQASDDYPKCHP